MEEWKMGDTKEKKLIFYTKKLPSSYFYLPSLY